MATELSVSRRVPLESVTTDPAQKALVEALIAARLLVTDRADDGSAVVGVAHEALLRHWPRLRAWLEEDREFLRTRARIASAEARWREEGRNADYLLAAGKPLAEAEELLRGRRPDLSAAEAEFIAVSAKAARANARRKLRRLQLVSAVLLALTVAASLAGWQAIRKSREARRALSLSDYNEANRLISGGAHGQALAYLARAVRLNPANEIASARLLNLLTYRNWPLPSSPPLKHAGSVAEAQFSADGALLITASNDSTARIWQTASGDPLGEPLRHEGEVVAATFSPDGKYALTASADMTARIWETATGRMIGEPLRCSDGVTDAVFSADGKRIATASKDKTARVWDALTGRPLTAPLAHPEWVRAVRFSPDGTRLLTASADTIHIWDAAEGRSLLKLDGGPAALTAFVNTARWSRDGKRIATARTTVEANGAQKNEVALRDAATGAAIGAPLQHSGMIWSVEFSPDGRRALTASFDGTARLWDAATGKPIGKTLTHGEPVWMAEFNAEGTCVVTASADGTARVWDAATGDPLTEPMWHSGPVYRARFNPRGHAQIATASLDGTARIWNVARGDAIALPLDARIPSITSASFSPDGAQIATGSLVFNTATLWDAATGQPIKDAFSHAGTVHSASFSPDGKLLVTASADRTAIIWNVASGERATPPLEHTGDVAAASFSADGKRVATASSDRTARVWDAATGASIGPALEHSGEVRGAAFAPDGKRVLTISGGQAHLWDTATGKKSMPPLDCGSTLIFAAVFSPDGRRIATASSDKIVRVWDSVRGTPLLKGMAHDGPVKAVCFSPDGKRLVTGSTDKTVRLWDAQTGKPLGEPMPQSNYLNDVRFSPDGRRVVAVSGGGILFDVPAGPAPGWLPALAESVAGWRLDAESNVVNHLQATPAASGAGANDLDKWRAWFLGARLARAISPFSTIGMRQYVESLANKGRAESLATAMTLAPGDAAILARAGKAQNDPATAELFTSLALARAPGGPVAAAARAAVLKEQKRLPEALALIDRAIELDPRRADFYHEKAGILGRSERYADAAAAAGRAIDLSPDDTTFLTRRGYNLALAGEKDRALADYERALSLKPKDAQIHHRFGVALFIAGESARALLEWKASAELVANPARLAWLQSALAIGYWATGDQAHAIEAFQNAVKADPLMASADHIAGLDLSAKERDALEAIRTLSAK